MCPLPRAGTLSTRRRVRRRSRPPIGLMIVAGAAQLNERAPVSVHDIEIVRVVAPVIGIAPAVLAREGDLRAVPGPRGVKSGCAAVDPRDATSLGTHQDDFEGAVPAGRKGDLRAVRLPGCSRVGRRIAREARKPGTVGIDDTDVVVARVHLAVERDLRAVRGPGRPATITDVSG